MCERPTDPPAAMVFSRSFHILFTVLMFMARPGIAGESRADSVSAALHRFLQSDTGGRAGILFGRLDSNASVPKIWTEGAISVQNDLRIGCPFAKPCLAYIVLKEGIDLDWTIDRWFSEGDGFTKSHVITVKHLLLNSSGIRDYAQLVPMNPDSAITPASSIDRAYRSQPLLFDPGAGFEYSNTNFNIVGLILERYTGKTVSQLFREYFEPVAPSIRLDDGKGNYPRGYLRRWPYHWSSPGYAGGFIGTASDAMRAFAHIASQPEFNVMTRWYATDGSTAKDGENLLGLGLFGKLHFAGQGKAVVYEGNMGPCQMILARVRGSVFYIASSDDIGPARLSELFQNLVGISFQKAE